jgi:hypothetical protein
MEAIALHDFEPEQNDELEFRKGAILIVLKDNVERNWSKAQLCDKVGLVPKNFIRFRVIPGCCRFTSRNEAEELLLTQTQNHSYLIRESQGTRDEFSISVKHDKEIRHFKIFKDDDNKLFILDKKFSSMNDLIEYHKVHTLNRTEKIVLERPVSMPVKARVNFDSKEISELSFKKNDIITVTDYSDRNWWGGMLNDKVGSFPVPFVIPIDFPQ